MPTSSLALLALCGLLAGCGAHQACTSAEDCGGRACVNGACVQPPASSGDAAADDAAGAAEVDGSGPSDSADARDEDSTAEDAGPDAGDGEADDDTDDDTGDEPDGDAGTPGPGVPPCRLGPGCTAGFEEATLGPLAVACAQVAGGPSCAPGWWECSTPERAHLSDTGPAGAVPCCTDRLAGDACCAAFGRDCPGSHGFVCDTGVGGAPRCRSQDGRDLFVAGGTTLVGCSATTDPGCLASETPQTAVEVPPFTLARLEVSAAELLACYDEGSCREPLSADDPAATYAQADAQGELPANMLDWARAARVCHQRGQRLPTESEWELAARGDCARVVHCNNDPACCSGALGRYPWGKASPTCELAVTSECVAGGPGASGTAAAGAGPYGHLDLAGGVQEWVRDCSGADHADLPADGTARRGCGGFEEHVARGAGWTDAAEDSRSSRRWLPYLGLFGQDLEVAQALGARCAGTLYSAPLGCEDGTEEGLRDEDDIAACAVDGAAWEASLDQEACAEGWQVCTLADVRTHTEDRAWSSEELPGSFHLSQAACGAAMGARWEPLEDLQLAPGGGCEGAPSAVALTVRAGDPGPASHPLCGARHCESAPVDDLTGVLCCRDLSAGPATLHPAAAEGVLSVARTWRERDVSTAQAIAGLADGGLVVTWARTTSADSEDGDIFLRRFDARGRAVGPPVRVDAGFPRHKVTPAVATTSFGGWVVVWANELVDGDGLGILGRTWTPDEEPERGELHVNLQAAGEQLAPTLAATPGGGAVVAWLSRDFDGLSDGVDARLITPFGDTTAAIMVTAGSQALGAPGIAAHPGDSWTVCWTRLGGPAVETLVCRPFDPAGTPVGEEADVATRQSEAAGAPSLAAGSGDSVFIAWDGRLLRLLTDATLTAVELGDGAQHPALMATQGGVRAAWSQGGALWHQRFDDTGQPVGQPDRVDAVTGWGQHTPALAGLADGGFAVAWSGGQAGAETVLVRRFAPDGSARPATEAVIPDCAAADREVWCGL